MISRPQLLGPNGQPIDTQKRYDDGFALPHALQFTAIMGGMRTYWHDKWDEARRKSREQALIMRRDAFLMGLLNERMKAVSSLNWHLEVPDENDIVQAAVRDEMTKAAKGIHGLRRIIRSFLWATWYGRYGVQFVWKWQEQSGRRVLGVQKWKPVNGDKLGHSYSGEPYVLVNAGMSDAELPNARFVQTTYNKALALSGTWRDRFVIHYHDIDDADFMDPDQGERIHGVGVRDQLFWLNFLKLEWLALLSAYITRVGLGVNIWYYTSGNKAEREEAEKEARNFADKVNIFVPVLDNDRGRGPGLDRLEPNMSGAETVTRLMEYLDAIMERYVIGQTLSSDSEGSGLGGSGVADLHAATKQKIAASDAGDLEDTLTGSDDEPGLLSLIQRWSFPETMPDRPNGFQVRWKFDVEKSESKEKLEGSAKAWEMGIGLKADEVRAAAGLSKPGPGDEVVQPKQAEAPAPAAPGKPPELEPKPAAPAPAGPAKSPQPQRMARERWPLLFQSQYDAVAIQSGIDPSAVNQAAAELLEADRQHKRKLARVVRDTMKLCKALGHGDPTTLQMPAMENVAGHVARKHPDHFEDIAEAPETLAALLRSGAGQPLDPAVAWRQAFDELQRQRQWEVAQQQQQMQQAAQAEQTKRVAMERDTQGHEHAPPGSGKGGQFVGGGGGGSGNGSQEGPEAKEKRTETPSPHRAIAEKWVAASPELSPEIAKEYIDSMEHALLKLPPGISKEAHESLEKGKVSFHADLKSLRDEAMKLSGKKSAAGVVGFVWDKGSGSKLHLDGGDADQRGTYIHELWHCADEAGFHSDNPGFQAAYKKDILKGKTLLSKYAMTNASEGFAEFGRVLAVRGEEYMAEKFPNVVKHLKSKGLM